MITVHWPISKLLLVVFKITLKHLAKHIKRAIIIDFICKDRCKDNSIKRNKLLHVNIPCLFDTYNLHAKIKDRLSI